MAERTGAVVGFDHLVLTVASIERTVAFYERVLGMSSVTFGPDNRTALSFGNHKINLHEAGCEFEPKSAVPTPGSGDLCFIGDDLEAALARVQDAGVAILEGPVSRTGAQGPLRSLYIRDPDENLIELSVYA